MTNTNLNFDFSGLYDDDPPIDSNNHFSNGLTTLSRKMTDRLNDEISPWHKNESQRGVGGMGEIITPNNNYNTNSTQERKNSGSKKLLLDHIPISTQRSQGSRSSS